MHDLNASGMEQENAIAELRTILLRAALYFFSRNLGDFAGLSRDETLQRASMLSSGIIAQFPDQFK